MPVSHSLKSHLTQPKRWRIVIGVKMADETNVSQESAAQMADQPSKSQRLETFRATLKSTHSIEQAAEAAHISTRTATRWHRLIGGNEIKKMQRDASPPIEIESLKTTDGVLDRLRGLLANGSDTAAIAAGKALLEQYAISAMAGEFECPVCSRVYPDTPSWLECERAVNAKIPRPMTSAMTQYLEARRLQLAPLQSTLDVLALPAGEAGGAPKEKLAESISPSEDAAKNFTK